MWVKICGITNVEDAQAAVDAGADALGFVFAPSPRRISPHAAKGIIAALPRKVETVGVFVNQKAKVILETAEKARLTGVQLHGDESLDFAANLDANLGPNPTLRVIPVFPMRRIQEMAASGGAFVKLSGGLHTVLVDSSARGKRGGSGQTWDWELGKALIEIFRHGVRIIVAGGLTPANVGDAILALRPWGVDVSSGVERQPGKKDHERVRAFVKAAKNLNL